MKKMKRIVALIAMLAVLLSSFAFAEEIPAVEIVEEVAAASVPAEETPAEPAAEEAAEEETVVAELLADESVEEPVAEPAAEEAAPAEEEAVPAEEADDAPAAEEGAVETVEEPAVEPAAECDHMVLCIQPGFCVRCNQMVEGVEAVHPGNVMETAPELLPTDTTLHGYSCPACKAFLASEPHYVACNARDKTVCTGCGFKVNMEVTHRRLVPDIVPTAEGAATHGRYCADCRQFQDVEVHSISCVSTKPGVCDKCEAEVGEEYLTHQFVNGVCTACGYSLGVEELTVIPGEITLGVKEEYALEIIAEPIEAVDEVIIETSNAKIVDVDEEGVITGVKKGSAKVTVTATGLDGESLSVTIDVAVKTAPKSVTLTPKKASLYLGDVAQLKANIGGSSYASQLTWESSDLSVASVDEEGFLTATGIGTATITVSTFNGKTAKCTVEVTPEPTAILVEETEINMYYKQSLNLNAKLVSDDGTECIGEIEYESSHPKNVAVSASGVITVKKSAKGSAEITLTSANGLTEVVTVNVCDAPSKVTLEETEIDLIRGEEYQIEPIIADDEATVFTYSSSKKGVASVSKTGLIVAEGDGTATITVSTHNKKTAKLKVNVEDPYKPDEVELNESGTVYLSLGDVLQLDATLYPDTAESDFEWTSSKPKVAKVDEYGMVTPLKEGTAKITVSTYNGLTDSVTVSVVDPRKVAAVELDVSGTVNLPLGESLELYAEVLPSTAETELTWSSKTKKVATVDEYGVVEALKVGSTVITVKSANGKTDTVTIKVYDPTIAEKISLNVDSKYTVNVGEDLQLEVEIEPITAETELKWTSSSKKVATVDEDGLVKPLKKGSTTITVATDNGKKDTVKLTVTDNYKPTSIELPTLGVQNVGDPLTLVPSIEPANAMTYLVWKSYDEDVATVDEDGNVTLHAIGTATIAVKTHNGLIAETTLTVEDPYTPTSVVMSASGTVELGVDEFYKIYTNVLPVTAVTNLTWKSSDASVATVDADGLVTTLKAGRTTITVKTDNGKTDSLTIVVDGGKEPFTGAIELGRETTIAGLKSKLNLVEKKVWVEEQNGYRVYFADEGGHDTVIVNRVFGEELNKNKVLSIEIQRYSKYCVFGVTVGMTADAAARALTANGVSIARQTENTIITRAAGSFIMMEIMLDNGRVSSVNAYA